MDTYTTAHLKGMIDEVVNTPASFALDLFFPEIEEQETEEILWDKLPLEDFLAPFVAPDQPADAMVQKGFKTEIFKPAYVKPLHVVSPSQALKRRAGEPLAGALSPQQRRDLYVADLLEKQIADIRRRKEWMAWQVLTTGKVTVSGPKYPTTVVDFGRDPAHSETLSGTAKWDSGSAKIVDFFDDRATKVQDATGYAATTHVMGPGAWKLARANTEFRDLLDNRRQASGVVELGPYALADGDANSSITSARYVGTIGDHDFFVFAGKYTDSAGNRQSLLGDKTCLSIARRGIEGLQVHGAILDHESLEAVEFFPKMWDQDNPSRRYLMTQSAPLIVPGRVNAVNAAIVA